MHYGSLACSHLNQWFVAVETAAESNDKELTIDGRRSIDKVRARQPEFADVLDKGLGWTVIKKEAAARYPMLTKLVQQSRQIAGQLHNGETHYEMLPQIQETSVALADEKTGAIDWEAVQAASAVTQSRIIEDIPHLCTIIQMYGGGRKFR